MVILNKHIHLERFALISAVKTKGLIRSGDKLSVFPTPSQTKGDSLNSGEEASSIASSHDHILSVVPLLCTCEQSR